jgi:hypothetical protein
MSWNRFGRGSCGRTKELSGHLPDTEENHGKCQPVGLKREIIKLWLIRNVDTC